MNDYKFDLSISDAPGTSTELRGIKISDTFKNVIFQAVQEQLPQYLEEFPFLRGRSTHIYLNDVMMIFTAEYGLHMSAVLHGPLNDLDLIETSTEILRQHAFPDYDLLKTVLGEGHMSINHFTIITPVTDGKISYEHFGTVIVDWINDRVLPHILENNKLRVLNAIPPSPQYNVENILNNVFILEDESSDCMDELGRQGTCFYLKDVGFVTCDHVLTPKTQCFSSHNPFKKYHIKVVLRNPTIDLAILDIPDLINNTSLEGLEAGCADTLKQMDHVAIAGFPNYRKGDTGILSPGLIIGFRPVHGIHRLLVNAAIVSGNSGGPVVDASNKVIGVAVTGADCSEKVMETENHGVIPIEALDCLL